jgi:hypothetical protein
LEYQGSEFNFVTGISKTGPVDGVEANHGGIGPWTIRNTMLANGPDFKKGVVVHTPSSNVDVMPTLLSLLSLKDIFPAQNSDGRILT